MTPEAADAGREYESIDEFYAEHPRAARSPESDYGVWWKDERGGNWRVSYVHATGHVYAIRAAGGRTVALRVGRDVGMVTRDSPSGVDGPVVLLGRLSPVPRGTSPPGPAEAALKGWVDRCGTPGSLTWAAERVAAAAAARRGRVRNEGRGEGEASR